MGPVNAILRTNNHNGFIAISSFRNGDFCGCVSLQFLQFGASLAKKKSMMFLGDGDRGVSLGLEANQNFPLGAKNISLFASNKEGQGLILGAAHLDFTGSTSFNTAQLLVRFSTSKSLNIESLAFLSWDVEHLGDGGGLDSGLGIPLAEWLAGGTFVGCRWTTSKRRKLLVIGWNFRFRDWCFISGRLVRILFQLLLLSWKLVGSLDDTGVGAILGGGRGVAHCLLHGGVHVRVQRSLATPRP